MRSGESDLDGFGGDAENSVSRPDGESRDSDVGPRPYDIPPTPRTYVSQSWNNPGARREILAYLAKDYDWYLDRMLTSVFSGRNWDMGDLEDCLADVKMHFFAPTDAEMNSERRKFWLSGWDKSKKRPLRWYLLECVRNFVIDRHRRRRNGTGTGFIPIDDADGGGFHVADGGPTPSQWAEEREFEARYDKKLFLARALLEYERECGAGADCWRAYRFYTSGWPQPTMEHTAKTLGLTRDAVNTHIHRSRVRMLEILWLLIRGMEIDDADADQAMLVMVGRLPACRARREKPKW
jgi:DNA-directed RNA polymerase specialized sigma24 family protein